MFSTLSCLYGPSVPIGDLPELEKVIFDWGLQMNYNMPFNVSSFYMVPIWSTRSHVSRSQRELNVKDYTIDELYTIIENFLERWGFHRSCLQRSICELQQYPFEETHVPVITDVITYLLTPSRLDIPRRPHLSHYKTAELQGLLGFKCHQKFPECQDGLLNMFSIIN